MAATKKAPKKTTVAGGRGRNRTKPKKGTRKA